MILFLGNRFFYERKLLSNVERNIDYFCDFAKQTGLDQVSQFKRKLVYLPWILCLPLVKMGNISYAERKIGW
jgi:hypothetical protein